jgi:hypothetical protein
VTDRSHSHTRSLTHSLTHSLTRSLAHSLTHPRPHSPHAPARPPTRTPGRSVVTRCRSWHRAHGIFTTVRNPLTNYDAYRRYKMELPATEGGLREG